MSQRLRMEDVQGYWDDLLTQYSQVRPLWCSTYRPPGTPRLSMQAERWDLEASRLYP